MKTKEPNFILSYDGEADFSLRQDGREIRYSKRWFEAKTQKGDANGSKHLVGCIVWRDKSEPPVSDLEALHPGYIVAWYKPNGTFYNVEMRNGPVPVENREWLFFGEPECVYKNGSGDLVSFRWAQDCVDCGVYRVEDFRGPLASKLKG